MIECSPRYLYWIGPTCHVSYNISWLSSCYQSEYLLTMASYDDDVDVDDDDGYNSYYADSDDDDDS